MQGKRLRVNEYKLTYGQETMYINMYGAFKNKKNGNKYTIYSYENKNKLHYGTFFQRGKEAVIMSSKEDISEIIKEFTESLLNSSENEKYEILSLNEIETAQIIDEHKLNIAVDLNKLKDLTIPKIIVKEEKEENKDKKPVSIAGIFFTLFVIVVIAFFFVNPEVIMGKDKNYFCTKSYSHKSLPAEVYEELLITFNGKGEVINIDKTSDYKFTNPDRYKEFVDKSEIYQYMNEGDTYKLIEVESKYRVFSNIKIEETELIPKKEDELISYYQKNEYTCKVVDISE